ncbi:MAG: hypothetical protein U9R48_05655 [Chloroflexota bacterium]|nr:hypothetical protein [Chloroflexota bacterium]
MQSRTKKYLLVSLLLVMWLSTSACSCSGLLQRASHLRKNLISPTAAPTKASFLEEQIATPLPTPTRTATVPPAEAASSPTRTAAATPLRLPKGPDQPFDIRLTQEEINDYLEGQTFEQQGVVVSDGRVRIDAEQIIATFHVAHEGSGMSGGITVYGVPKVVDGQIYVEIEDFTLDQSVSGFGRLVANSLIKAAIEEYGTAHGIPVPLTDLEFEAIQLMPGVIRVAGRRR